jgi:hypothetical protein
MMFSKVTSLQGNVCAQVFTNGSYTSIHPLSLKLKVGPGTEFMKEVKCEDPHVDIRSRTVKSEPRRGAGYC